MNILVVNAGSSSVKYCVFSFPEEKVITQGMIEKIGEKKSKIPTHQKALLAMFKKIKEVISLKKIDAVGHRIVHGGPLIYQPTLLTKQVIRKLHTFDDLAPLHNPYNLLGVILCEKYLHCPHIGVFDTGFHHDLPEKSKTYAIPYQYLKKIRRYGFHGISHEYVALEASHILQKPLSSLRFITCHLGNGASLCAIKNGKSVDTSMGFTPLEGLVMGTRCGDIDPDIVAYLIEKEHLSRKEVFHILEKKSGLKGLAGVNDMRDLLAHIKKGNSRAKLAFDAFCYRIIKYLGAYLAVLGGADGIIFTAGIGEHAPLVRHEVLSAFHFLGIVLDPKKNQKNEVLISKASSTIPVFVIPTNEALMIAMKTKEFLLKKK
ncbi:acetate kinase [Candidatus Woesearchaeota archaeon]|nr:acetate kinase [Candidatus Woesearchaeota archaeon]